MSDDAIEGGQNKSASRAPGQDEPLPNHGSPDEAAQHLDEVPFDVAGAALGALNRTEETDLYAAAASDPAVSAALAGMEAVAAELARLAPEEAMNPGRSAGIRSRLVARAAGTRLVRTPAFTPMAAPEPSRSAQSRPRSTRAPLPGHVTPGRSASGTHSSAAAGAHKAPPAQASAPRSGRPPRLVPFEPVSRAGLERIIGIVAIAAVLVVAAFGLYTWKTRVPARNAQTAAVTDSILESQIAVLTEAVRQKDSLIADLTGTQTRVIDLMGYNSVDPMARVFWDQRKQTFIMYASHVKQPPGGKTYQLWLIARGAASPISAGTFMPDSAGSAVMATRHPMEPGTLRRIAVTQEPMGGMPTPTGPIVFTGTAK